MFPSVDLPETSLQHLLKDILSRTNDLPHNNSFALSIKGSRCGHVFYPALEALHKLPSIRIENATRTVHVTAKSDALDHTLATIAHALNDAGHVSRWRDELLDLWAANNRSLGAIERGVVRPLGALTQAVHLNAWSEDGGLWVARRSLTKPTDPGMWDTLVGGLIAFGEPPELALERESLEEAGLTPENLANRTPIRNIALMRRQLPEGYQREQVLTSECVLPRSLTPMNQDGESMTIQCLSPERVLVMLENGEFTIEASMVILEDLIYRVSRKRVTLPNH